jgi:hypothetical protein
MCLDQIQATVILIERYLYYTRQNISSKLVERSSTILAANCVILQVARACKMRGREVRN